MIYSNTIYPDKCTDTCRIIGYRVIWYMLYLWKNKDGKIELPMIHVYGFTNEANKESALAYFVERIGLAMEYPEFKADDVTCFHPIRDVSPQSHMYSTSFRLPEVVAFSQK